MCVACLESQGCCFIPLSYLLFYFYSSSSCSFCLVIFQLVIHYSNFCPPPTFFKGVWGVGVGISYHEEKTRMSDVCRLFLLFSSWWDKVVWNLRAVIWFPFPISTFMFLPSPLSRSVIFHDIVHSSNLKKKKKKKTVGVCVYLTGWGWGEFQKILQHL